MKIKVGLIIGFNGKGFHGLQHNLNLKTIELEIINSLLKLKSIKPGNTQPDKIGLQRSSRTDKGVHAGMCLITLKIEHLINDEFVCALKSMLIMHNIYLYKIFKLPRSFNPQKKCSSRVYEYYLPAFVLNDGLIKEKVKKERHGLFKELMMKYKGTKNYHNFTTKSNEKGHQRYIQEIYISDPYLKNGVEYILIRLQGNSFLLHQIRKMIGYVLSLIKFKGEKAMEMFDIGFRAEYINIPKAPSEFLMLDRQYFYTSKNKANEHITVNHSLGGSEINDNSYEIHLSIDEAEKDKMKSGMILPEIYKEENLSVFKNWYEIFDKHSYSFEYLQ